MQRTVYERHRNTIKRSKSCKKFQKREDSLIYLILENIQNNTTNYQKKLLLSEHYNLLFSNVHRMYLEDKKYKEKRLSSRIVDTTDIYILLYLFFQLDDGRPFEVNNYKNYLSLL